MKGTGLSVKSFMFLGFRTQGLADGLLDAGFRVPGEAFNRQSVL